MVTAALDTCPSLGVSVLHWPHDSNVRQHLATFRQPRILLVEPGRDLRCCSTSSRTGSAPPRTPPTFAPGAASCTGEPSMYRARGPDDRRPGLAVGGAPVGGPHPRADARRDPPRGPPRPRRALRVGERGLRERGGSSHAASLRTLLTRIRARGSDRSASSWSPSGDAGGAAHPALPAVS